MLVTLLRTFFEICRLRLGPQDLPASPELLTLVLGAYAACAALLTLLSRPAYQAVVGAVVETALLAALMFALLQLRRLDGRWLQTTTAMAGTGVLFTLVALPLFATFAGAAPGLAQLMAWGLLLLILWNVAVTAHIFRHALSVSFAAALVLAALYTWVVVMAIDGLFPDAA